MAIHSKLVDLLKTAAVSVSWSAVALFFDGLFWRALFLLGDLFIYVGNCMHSFGAIARGPPLPPPDSTARKSPEPPELGMATDVGHSTPNSTAERVSWVPDVHPIPTSTARRVSRVPHVHPIPTSTASRVSRVPDVQWSTKLPDKVDEKLPEVAHEVQEQLPEFLCTVSCHRRWQKWYAIVIGRQPGLYNCWNCAEDMVSELRGNMHKSFRYKLDAERFLRKEWHCLHNHSQGFTG